LAFLLAFNRDFSTNISVNYLSYIALVIGFIIIYLAIDLGFSYMSWKKQKNK